MGAWIETLTICFRLTNTGVAPYVGAWIETRINELKEHLGYVAPYVGAWIETFLVIRDLKLSESRTLRGCVD